MRALVLLLAAGHLLHLQAQELVPNGDMEQFTACPDQLTQIDRATGWSRPTEGSSDYFNACQTASFSMGAPQNLMGYQAPHSGDGYVGIICFAGPDASPDQDIREYVDHALAAPLVPGSTYSVTYYVSLGEYSRYAVNDIGALFSVQPPHRTDMAAITAEPQIANGTAPLLTDTSGWTMVHDCFTADSAYAYITIGHFHPVAGTTYGELPWAWSGGTTSYYYVDDVSVQPLTAPALGPDITTCGAVSLALAVLPPDPTATYHWSTGNTGPSITVQDTGTYSVWSGEGACRLSDTIVVRAGTPVTFGVPADTLVDLCRSPEVVLDARPLPTDAMVSWSTGAHTATALLHTAGVYRVEASAPDHCPASTTITVIDTCGVPVYAPNAFTPNGDGTNDRWRPIWSAGSRATLEWTVFDRWGHALFQAEDRDQGWDGSAAGAPVPDGLYDWRGRAYDPDTDVVRELTGHILLMR